MKVFLHVGPWKTGTTAIQKLLLEAGDRICYPHPSADGPGHHLLAMQADDPEGGAGDRNILVQTVRREASQGLGKPVVLSSETFSLASSHPLMAQRMSELSECFHTELVITLRPMLQKLYSYIQENVKGGILDDFNGQEISWDLIMSKNRSYDRFIDRMLGLGHWRKCHIVPTDRNRPDFIIDAFSDILGVPLPRRLDPAWANRAMPYMQMRILLGLHRDNPGYDKHLLFERSREMFSELQKSDPETAATPFPPLPENVQRHYEALDASTTRRMLDLETRGRVVVHRPKEG